nr:hypothetical protein [Candidatus Njordarchaeota archaeon]
MPFRKKGDKKKQSRTHGGKKSRRVARAGTTPRISLAMPSDAWWEETFKLGVERSAAEAALNSLEEARKEGIIGTKIYDRLREVYAEKLCAIDDRAAVCYQRLPKLSEPAGRREMMQELSKAVTQPSVTEATTPSKSSIGQILSSDRGTASRTAHPTFPAAPRKVTEMPGGASNPRRAMIDELKSVLSSASPFQAKAPRSKTVVEKRVNVPEERLSLETKTEKRSTETPPRVQGPIASGPSSSQLPTKLMELNREFLAEFKKLRKPSS